MIFKKLFRTLKWYKYQIPLRPPRHHRHPHHDLLHPRLLCLHVVRRFDALAGELSSSFSLKCGWKLKVVGWLDLSPDGGLGVQLHLPSLLLWPRFHTRVAHLAGKWSFYFDCNDNGGKNTSANWKVIKWQLGETRKAWQGVWFSPFLQRVSRGKTLFHLILTW